VSFDALGYALLPQFVARDELPGLRRAVDETLTGPLPTGCERANNVLAPLQWNHPLVEALLSPDRAAAVRAAANGDDLRFISAYVSVREPRSGELEWHRDWWCWDHPVTYRREASQVAVLCYLADTTETNAALRVVPGSHRKTPAPRRPRTLAARAGDAVVIDYRLLHGTHANRTGHRRDALLVSFTPSWKRLPRDIRAHLIRHPALPTAGEVGELLPHFDGTPLDLPVNREAPAQFAATG
jgi:ectoine hydroxylase-related dioxygenase (phytanoyl-CoA dioxygenase family)